MSTRPGHPIDRGTAERILRDGHAAWSASCDPLARLLAAATAPASGRELALYETAVAAFRTTHLANPFQARRRSMIKHAVAKLLTVKIAAVTAAVVGVSGVALAASTGTIPNPLHDASPAASQGQAGGKASPSDQRSDRPTDKSSGRPDPAAVPSGLPPGLYWLCKDYIGRDADRGKALGEEKFHELADKVGKDRNEADKFCDKLLNGRPGATPGAGADHATKTPPAHGNDDFPVNRPSGPAPGSDR